MRAHKAQQVSQFNVYQVYKLCHIQRDDTLELLADQRVTAHVSVAHYTCFKPKLQLNHKMRIALSNV